MSKDPGFMKYRESCGLCSSLMELDNYISEEIRSNIVGDWRENHVCIREVATNIENKMNKPMNSGGFLSPTLIAETEDGSKVEVRYNHTTGKFHTFQKGKTVADTRIGEVVQVEKWEYKDKRKRVLPIFSKW